MLNAEGRPEDQNGYLGWRSGCYNFLGLQDSEEATQREPTYQRRYLSAETAAMSLPCQL